MLIFVLLLILLTIGGFLLLKEKESNNEPAVGYTPPKEIPNLREIDKEKGNVSHTGSWRTYKSPLGFGFDYLTGWGDPKEEINSYNAPYAESGQWYTLTFSDTYFTSATGQSADARAGRGSISSDFRGYSDRPSGVQSYIDVISPGCYTMGENTFLGIIEFNLPDKQISGVKMFFRLLSAGEREHIYEIFDIPEVPVNCDVDEELAAKYEAKGREIVDYIESGESLSEGTLKNIEVFKHVVESSKVL